MPDFAGEPVLTDQIDKFIVATPVETLQRIYAELDLGEFEALKPSIIAYFDARADYRAGHYDVAPALAREIARRWTPLMANYGYASR